VENSGNGELSLLESLNKMKNEIKENVEKQNKMIQESEETEKAAEQLLY